MGVCVIIIIILIIYRLTTSMKKVMHLCPLLCLANYLNVSGSARNVLSEILERIGTNSGIFD